MTLITLAASADWLAVAADRRLTWDSDSARTRDLENKVAILDGGRLIVGYAGEVKWLPGKARFEEWLLTATRGLNPTKQMAALRAGLQREWDTHYESVRPIPPLAVVGVGYRFDKQSGALRPILTAVSNSMDSHFVYNPHRARERFVVQTEPVPYGTFTVAAIGAYVEPWELEPLSESLKPNRLLTSQSVGAIRNSLLVFHSETAEASNGFVGTQAMVVTVPRAAWPIQNFAVELSVSPSRDYSRSVVAYTHNDPAVEALPDVPHFGPAMDLGFGYVSSIEVRTDATGRMIGPRANLREMDE